MAGKTREEFIDLLDLSRQIAWDLAAYLQKKGNNVRIIPSSTVKDGENRWHHVDQGDLEITQRIEVKHWPNVDFKSVAGVPYKRIIVDEAYKVEKQQPSGLYAYVIVNASRTGFLFVPAWTRSTWVKEQLHDSRDNRDACFYLVEKKHVTYVDMEE